MTKTENPTKVSTHQGTVHYARTEQFGKRTLVGPACQKFDVMALHSAIPTEAEVTCKRCAKMAEGWV